MILEILDRQVIDRLLGLALRKMRNSSTEAKQPSSFVYTQLIITVMPTVLYARATCRMKGPIELH